VHISGVVAGIAAIPGLAAYGLRDVLPLPASILLWHIAGTGMVVAAAASEALAGHTTGLLGKVGNLGEGCGWVVAHGEAHAWLAAAAAACRPSDAAP
jgi:hypothetical protein